ncbi:MAG: hypothetical protein ACLP0L_22155 [Solirubrobacteraceae bacterium]
MAQGISPRLALGMLLAALVAGCGSASSSTSSTAPRTRTAAASASASATTTATATTSTQTHPLNFAAAIPPGPPTSIPGGTAPAGWVRYQENGFSFLAPSGFKPTPNGVVSGLPKTASVRFLTPAGEPIQKTSDQPMLGFNSKLQFDIDQVTTNLMASDSNNPSVTHVHTAVSAVTVDGAEEARIVSESYSTRASYAEAFERTWLMVVPRAGVLLDLVVVNEPGRGVNLHPATVLGSFRLRG